MLDILVIFSSQAISRARNWEASRDFHRAIEAYLDITPAQAGGDLDQVEELWEAAVRLANTHSKARYPDVVARAATQLQGVKRFHAAADLFKDIERYRDAIDCYVSGGIWDKARALCSMAPGYRARVDRAYQDSLLKREAADELVEAGNVDAGLDVLARRGQWPKVFAVCRKQAGKHGRAQSARYATEHATQLLGEAAGGGGLANASQVSLDQAAELLYRPSP